MKMKNNSIFLKEIKIQIFSLKVLSNPKKSYSQVQGKFGKDKTELEIAIKGK